ncbi:NAD(P)-dependent oxidoreductase [Kushneria aurantia]|uniref:NAD(P)-dependent oxidoreductase n=1 Tax=Kushneria aurantia TaxID=504092 RepID=A0ABV6G1Q7_9GAMM|nr:NAD(P)-dependent oxidoreductase [Kushneria aurantia]
MTSDNVIRGVYLSDTLDLAALYDAPLGAIAEDVRVLRPEEVDDPREIRFAVCWQPGEEAFAPYPELALAMSIGAGVDALLAHPGLDDGVEIARVRDPHQADLMAGFAAHEILHHERAFETLARSAGNAHWAPLPMRAPAGVTVAILGAGTMGRAIARGMVALGFGVRVAATRCPQPPLDGVSYCWGEDALQRAAEGADYLVNVLPLTAATDNVLNSALFARLNRGAWLVQIGRGEHLVEPDLLAALDEGTLSGATLDVFRQEPLPADHPFWRDSRLRITPHIASDSLPEVVARQVVEAARAVRDGGSHRLGISRQRGY